MKIKIFIIMTIIMVLLSACSKEVKEQQEKIVNRIEQTEQTEQEENTVQIEQKENIDKVDQIEEDSSNEEAHYIKMPDGTEVLTNEGYLAVAEVVIPKLEELKERPKNAKVVTPQEILNNIYNNVSGEFLVDDYPYYKSYIDEIYPLIPYRPEDDDNPDPLSEKYELIKATGNMDVWANIKKFDKYLYFELYAEE